MVFPHFLWGQAGHERLLYKENPNCRANNIARTEEYNGGTPEAYALADKMSATWAAFAHTGDPNNGGLPEWEAFTGDNGATLVIDNASEMRYHHDQELLDIVSSVQRKWH